MMLPSEDSIARMIGYFYFEKNDRDYVKAHKEIDELQITGISHNGNDENSVFIKLHRPGLLIGEKGKNIEALLAYLRENTEMKKLNLRITEDNINYRLHGFDVRDYD